MQIRVKRILAAVIDLCIISFIGVFMHFFIFYGLTDGILKNILVVVGTILESLIFLFKDLFFGKRSFGKRFFKLKIVKKDGTKLTALDLIKRNLTFILLPPIEVLLILITGEKLGDTFAKTTVIYDYFGGSIGNL